MGVRGVRQCVIRVNELFVLTSINGSVDSLVKSRGNLSTKMSENSLRSSLYGSGRFCGGHCLPGLGTSDSGAISGDTSKTSSYPTFISMMSLPAASILGRCGFLVLLFW